MLADKFLGGDFRNLPLNQISELAISEADLTTVQDFIRKIFEKLEPTAAHLLMCTFRWWAIATTNFDLLVERAYQKGKAVQIPVPFVENGDRSKTICGT